MPLQKSSAGAVWHIGTVPTVPIPLDGGGGGMSLALGDCGGSGGGDGGH